MGSLTESWRRRYDSPEESTDPLHQMHSNHIPTLVISPLRFSRIPSRSLSPFLFCNFCAGLHGERLGVLEKVAKNTIR